MRFALTEDRADFRDAVRALLADTCPPEAVRAAWGGEVGAHTGGGGGDGRVRAAWSALADMGVLGIAVPEAQGGLGLGDSDVVPLLVECGRAGLPDPVSATAYVAATLLARVAGSDDPTEAPGASTEAADWCRRIAAGEAAVVGAGADVVPGAPVAAAATAAAVVVAGPGSLRIVPADEVALEPLESVDGARGLCRVSVPDGAGTVLATGGAADALHAAAADRAALGAAAELVGLGERMLAMTIGYVGERRQFGVPVGSFQAVKHHLADASLAVAFAAPLVLRAAESLHVGDPEAGVHVSMAKAKASDAARAAAAASLQCHGAIGYTVEYDLHLFMKRSWALAAAHGDAAHHRRRVRAALLG